MPSGARARAQLRRRRDDSLLVPRRVALRREATRARVQIDRHRARRRALLDPLLPPPPLLFARRRYARVLWRQVLSARRSPLRRDFGHLGRGRVPGILRRLCRSGLCGPDKALRLLAIEAALSARRALAKALTLAVIRCDGGDPRHLAARCSRRQVLLVLRDRLQLEGLPPPPPLDLPSLVQVQLGDELHRRLQRVHLQGRCAAAALLSGFRALCRRSSGVSLLALHLSTQRSQCLRVPRRLALHRHDQLVQLAEAAAAVWARA